MCEQILKSDLHFPAGCGASAEARDLIRALLQRDPAQRLGSRAGGVADIHAHPFFRGVDWASMQRGAVEPPFKPKVESDTDITNFDATFTSEPAVLTPPAPSELSEAAAAGDDFRDFGYVNASKLVSMLGSLPGHLLATLTGENAAVSGGHAAKSAAASAASASASAAAGGGAASAGASAAGAGASEARVDSDSRVYAGFDGGGAASEYDEDAPPPANAEDARPTHDVAAVAAEMTRLSESGVGAFALAEGAVESGGGEA
jgi:hypothetical protein